MANVTARKPMFDRNIERGSFMVWEINLIILCLLIVWGMILIFMVHLSFYAIPLLIYDVMYDITTIP